MTRIAVEWAFGRMKKTPEKPEKNASGSAVAVEEKEEVAVISAFVVTKDGDNSQVELFITNEDQNPILKQETNGTYKGGKYIYNPKTQELSIDGKVTYTAKN